MPATELRPSEAARRDRPLDMSEAEFRSWAPSNLSIGGSDVGAIIGVNQYRTPSDVWDSLMGAAPPFEGNRHSERGNDLESYIRGRYSRETGRTTYVVRQIVREAHGVPLRYTPDGLIAPTRGVEWDGRGILEVKAPQEEVYTRYRQNGIDPSYVAQVHHYMKGFGCEWASFAIFNPNAWVLWTVDLPFDAEFFHDELRAKVVAFWHEHILTRTRPEPALNRVSQIPVVGAEVTDLTGDPEWRRIAATLKGADEARKLADHRYKLAKERAQEFLDQREIDAARGAGVKVYYREQGRKSFDRELFAQAHPEIDLDAFNRQTVSRSFRLYVED